MNESEEKHGIPMDVSSPLSDETPTPVLGENDEMLELDEKFTFEDFQVVRREFFAHLKEPSVSFNQCKFYVNSACLTKFPDTFYAQVLVNREKKILALRPCSEGARDSFMWCTQGSDGKRKPKSITCRLFFAKIFSLMDWNPDFRYKLLGKLVHANGEYLIVFDLSATEVYQRTSPEGAKPKLSRTPTYPLAWQDQFGLPLNEHRRQMQIDIFDGYAVYSIKETTPEQQDAPEKQDGTEGTEAATQLTMIKKEGDPHE